MKKKRGIPNCARPIPSASRGREGVRQACARSRPSCGRGSHPLNTVLRILHIGARRASFAAGLTCLFALPACGPRAADKDQHTLNATTLSVVDTLAARTCGEDVSSTARVPFSRVRFGGRIDGGMPLIPGPEVRAVARTEDEWNAVWRRLADTVPSPSVSIGDSVLVVASSKELTSGPAELEIVDVRRCSRVPAVVVLTRLHRHELANDYGARPIAVGALARSGVSNSEVRFVDLPPVLDR